MHFPVAVAVAIASALPAVLAQSPDQIEAQANAELGKEVDKAIAQNLKSEDTAPVYYNPATRLKLFGTDNTYQPYTVACPANVTWVRPATDGIAPGEKDYISKRWPKIEAAFKTKMQEAGLQQQPPRTPVIALSLSGGGYRAMINGLGMTMALMNESDEAKTAGTGGWLDAVTYMAGLSGGSWATGTFIANNAPLPLDLVHNVWNLDSNLIFPDNDKLSFYTKMLSNVRAKTNEGFPTQITDYWALALGNHLLPGQFRLNSSANLTFDDVLFSEAPKLQTADVPFPIIIAAEREPGQYIIGTNATVWEFTPYEFGSWAIGDDKQKAAGLFSPIEYLGTGMNNAQPNGTCYRGFDQLSFVMGTSSTLFNGGILRLQQMNDTGPVLDVIKDILKGISKDQNDISQIPNPYRGYTGHTNPLSSYQTITLTDAGLTNQNIPLEPLIVPERKVDAILAFDNSADTNYSWPNGSALYTTYERALRFAEANNSALLMPEVPNTDNFVAEGLNQRPVFFGCNRTDVPLIIYVPHYPWTYYSNSSTYELEYKTELAAQQMQNAMRSLTLNGTVPSWPKCLACAVSDRAFGYTTANRSADCAQCFDTWCWSGQNAQSIPENQTYSPLLGVTPSFLVDKNLSNSVQTTGTNFSAASSSASTAAKQTGKNASSSDNSKKSSAPGLMGPSTMVATFAAGVFGGAVLLML